MYSSVINNFTSKDNIIYRKFSSFIILIFGLFYIFLFYLSFVEGKKIIEKYAPLVDAAMEIRLEATVSHQHLEEMLCGEKENSIVDALVHINESIWYANAMLNGGVNSEGIFLPLEDIYMRNKIADVLSDLKHFKEATINRFENSNTEEDILHFKEMYHDDFNRFIKDADDVETRIQQLIVEELETYEILNIVLFSLSIITLISIIVFKRKQDKESKDFIKKIEEQNRLLTELSNTDALTNIANRRYFDEFSKEKFAWAKRKKESISIIMIDIDYFKKYNDTYGHTEGDKCLQKISLEMKHHLRRPTDLLARYGGEEFVIVLLDTNNVEEFVDRIRKSIEELKILHEQSDCSEFVTISAGISTGIPSEDAEPYLLVVEADKALYEAKEIGRNCVVIFNDDIEKTL